MNTKNASFEYSDLFIIINVIFFLHRKEFFLIVSTRHYTNVSYISHNAVLIGSGEMGFCFYL